MNSILKYRTCERKLNKTTLEFELDLKKFINFYALEQGEAEREVLHNLNKIELMQCIGLKDKAGSLIYFGDILVDEMNNLLTPVFEISNSEHTLFFKPVQFLNSELTIGCKSTYSDTLRVIGNIYKNSELFAGLQEKNKFINLIISARYNGLTEATIHIELNKAIYN